MTPSKLAIGVLGLIMLAAQVKGARKVTVDSGVRFFHNYLVLVAGDEALAIDLRTGEEDELATKADTEVPNEMRIQAAFATGESLTVFFYGPDYGFRLNLQTRETQTLRYGPLRKFLQNGGPDAAARRHDKVYFFRGCDMVRRLKWNKWGRRKNVTDIGLPCHPDAAWNIGDGNKVVVLKGDQIWIWDENDNVDGPMSFSSMYNITSWELIPSDEK